MKPIENLPWWTQGLIVAAALAVLVGVVHAVPPEWAWIALAIAIATVVFFLLFNPRYRFLRLSSLALRGWLGVRAIGSLSLLVFRGNELWLVDLVGDTPWSFDIAMAAVVLGLGLLDYFNNGGEFSIRLTKIGPVDNDFGNVANQVAGDHSTQSLTQVAGDQIVQNVQVDPNKTIGEAEQQLKERSVDVTVFTLEQLKRDYPDLLTKPQRLRVAKTLAHAYQTCDECDKAAEQHLEAREHAANEHDAAIHEGFAHWLLAEPEKALNLANSVLNEAPNHEEAWFLAALTDRDPAAALAFRETVPRQHQGKLNILSALVFRSMSQTDWNATLTLCEAMLREDAERVTVKQAVGRAYAAVAFDGWTERHQRPMDEINKLARNALEFLSEGLKDKAIGPVSRADLLYHRSLVNRVLGESGQSESDMKAARDLQPHNPNLLFQHCVYLVHEDRLDEAIDLLNKISGSSLSEGPGLVLARLLFRANKEDSARNATRAEQLLIDVLDNAQGEDQTLVYEPLEVLCTELARRGDRGRAEKHLESYRGKLEPVGEKSLRAAIEFADNRVDVAREIAKEAHSDAGKTTPPVVSVYLSKLLTDLQLDDEATQLLSQILDSPIAGFVTDLALNVGNRAKNYRLVLDVAERMRVQGRPTVRSAELEIGILESVNEFDAALSQIDCYLAGCDSGTYFKSEDQNYRQAFVKALHLRRSLLGFRLGRSDLINKNPIELPGLDECGEGKPLPLEVACATASLLANGPNPELGHALAVDIFRQNHDIAIAHQCLIQVCGPSSDYDPTPPVKVTPGVSVCFFDESSKKLEWRTVVESGAKAGQHEISHDHPLAQALLDKRVGDPFIDESDPLLPRFGTVHELRDATHYRVMNALQNWRERFGDPSFIRQFNFEGPDGKFDVNQWIEIHEKLNEPLEAAKRIFRYDLSSIAFFATVTGRLILEATGHFASQAGTPLRYSDGSTDERDRSMVAVRSKSRFVLDPSTIATLFLIEAPSKLNSLGDGVIVSAGTLEQLRQFYRNPHSRLHSERIGGVENGRPFYVEYSAEVIQKNIDEFEAFVDWLESVSTVQGGRPILELPSRLREEMCKFFGTESVESMAIACHESALLISDDLYVTQYPGLTTAPEKVNSFYFLHKLRDEGILAEPDRVELVHQLIASDYRFTPLDQGVIAHAVTKAECRADNPNLQCIIDWLHRSGADANDAAAAGAAITAKVWSETILADRRSLVIREVARSLEQHPAPFIALRRFKAELASVFEGNESAFQETSEAVDISLKRRGRGELLILPGNPKHFLPAEIRANLRART